MSRPISDTELVILDISYSSYLVQTCALRFNLLSSTSIIWSKKPVLNPFLLILSYLLIRHVDYPAPTSNLFQSATTTLTSPTWCFGPSSGCNQIGATVLGATMDFPIWIKVMATIS